MLFSADLSLQVVLQAFSFLMTLRVITTLYLTATSMYRVFIFPVYLGTIELALPLSRSSAFKAKVPAHYLQVMA